MNVAAPQPLTAKAALRFGPAIMRRLDELARLSSDADGLTRLYLTPEHKGATALVAEWMGQAGMSVEIDAAGTVVGRYPGSVPDAPVLLIGSHIDTVRNAGRFDGMLGVVLGIEAVADLSRCAVRLPFGIEVLAFGDEEGVRFPVTLTGSRALSGTFDLAWLDAKDQDGTSLRDALTAFGCDPSALPALARPRNRVLGYVEVHIEQGPVLEAEGVPVGVVTAISGASRCTLEVVGQAGHAGTVPMRLRHDALAAAAEMVLEVERIAAATPDLVATVGQFRVSPGAVNVIPGQVAFTLDVRSPRDAVRAEGLADIRHASETIANRRGVALTVNSFYEEQAATCAPWIMDGLEAAATRLGISAPRLASGAGHDGLAMRSLCPIGMLFVRCERGISHNPAESILPADADVAARVLIDFLQHFSPATAGQ